MPTPAMAFLTADMRCDAGVMISASHNPYQDNGIKFFAHDGFKLPDDVEARIEELIVSRRAARACAADPDEIGRARRIEDAAGRYVVFLKKTFPLELTLDGLRVVLDCANGAAYKVGPTVLVRARRRGVPDRHRAERPQHQPRLRLAPPRAAGGQGAELRADVGIAVDGDADRVVLVSERGEVRGRRRAARALRARPARARHAARAAAWWRP